MRLVIMTAILLLGASSAWASEAECLDLKNRIIARGPKPDDRVLNVALFEAAEKGCIGVAEDLFSHGATAAVRRSNGESTLHAAARAGELAMAKLLLGHKAIIDLRDLQGAHPLFLAAEAKRRDMVTFLLAEGAPVNQPGRSDATALSAAAFAGSKSIVEQLLAAGADAKLADKTGKTPVLYAAARGFQPIAELLLAQGIDINARYAHNLTLLMWSSGHANDVPEEEGRALVALVADKGAHLDDTDDRGYTALMIAAELGHVAVISELLKRGAAKDVKAKDGKTAADLASDEAVKAALALNR